MKELSINVDQYVSGRSWDAPSAPYSSDDNVSHAGIAISDLDGVLPAPHVQIFVAAGTTGTMAFLTAEQTIAFAKSLTDAAIMLRAGATQFGCNA